jgi:hypothetical protein
MIRATPLPAALPKLSRAMTKAKLIDFEEANASDWSQLVGPSRRRSGDVVLLRSDEASI